jgi:transcriptional regulator with XRE-family HTH domain
MSNSQPAEPGAVGNHRSVTLVKQTGRPLTGANGGRSGLGSAVRWDGAGRWDRAGILRRARREADLSQREMAERIGVSRATVARAELANVPVSIAVVEAILAQAGLRIIVVDGNGAPVAPMRPDAARNHGERRYAAHLDAWIPTRDDEPLGGWRRDRPKPRLTFHHRFWRDERRRRYDVRPRDHSSELELRLARHLRRRRPDWWDRVKPEPRQYEPCGCGPRCVKYCVANCWCQCEPVGCDLPNFGDRFG